MVLLPATAAAICVPSCEVASGNPDFGVGFFASPLVVVTSGDVVTWTSIDAGHTATDRVRFCFHVIYDEDGGGSATFSIVAGTLFAKVGTTTKACTSATALPDGSKLLPYECLYHPTMKGQLLVK